MFDKILVGIDGSEGSWKAFEIALELARLGPNKEVWAVSVEERLPHLPELIDEFSEEKERQNAVFQAVHQEAQRLADGQGVTLHVETIIGHAAQAIVGAAQEGRFDLVVLGHSGHSGVWGGFLGGTADKIVRHAPCHVLVVR